MKKLFTILMALVMSVACLSMAACQQQSADKEKQRFLRDESLYGYDNTVGNESKLRILLFTLQNLLFVIK